ncbi:RNA recognition motif 2-domain-containing protein [Suillus paluster]|uniref:RNA recognition motif 2-domain-containing protein n=1 Tax=Suillus paluster TaxID=48578 RepID=UPI001B875013|nr:RNA recognition motif 2-domain-containing protein [Suillus paluster]KAG1734756.1 RNA recognition motif 2-domain-containing protein [Suillus paluster]
MVKNIPNKMTDKELITYINKVCPRKIDFLYLRMDFQNGCNVGYAFVNFISVQDLLRFAKARLNEKWNIYSSEKVLQMSYANYQGKEALVEKFKNSCIMDEREEWRPKIFYSEPGPNQGLPEEFPKPTHIRRKERSSYNRGTLYPPGVSTGGGHYRYLNAGNVSNVANASSRQQPRESGEDRRRRRGAESVPFPSMVGVEVEDTTRA